MTAITQISSKALHAATSAIPKATAQLTHASTQAIEHAASQALPAAESTLPTLGQQLQQQASQFGNGNLTVGKALLAIAASVLAFFIIGPFALKMAARSAGFLLKTGVFGLKNLLNPQFLTSAAQKGLMFFATLETALPFIKPILTGMPISQRLAGLSNRVAQFGQQLTENAPRLAQMAGHVAGPEAGKAVEFITGPQITSLVQRAGEFLKRLTQGLPEATQQAAKAA